MIHMNFFIKKYIVILTIFSVFHKSKSSKKNRQKSSLKMKMAGGFMPPATFEHLGNIVKKLYLNK